MQLITVEEAKEGVDARMDRRSLKRLLARLSNEGQLKNMRIVLRYIYSQHIFRIYRIDY